MRPREGLGRVLTRAEALRQANNRLTGMKIMKILAVVTIACTIAAEDLY